ncbi:serine--tRNA ligase [Balneolaceae bacterium ANBcel3]|nr:serine--tRNA ligase [Balneolaceae bacterium ANBcel3]
MLDIQIIRTQPEMVKEAMRAKKEKDTHLVDELIETDEKWRNTVFELDKLRKESNSRAKEIGQLMGQGKKEEAAEVIRQTGEMKQSIKQMEEDVRTLAQERTYLLLRIPNMAHESVPVTEDESGNQMVHHWGFSEGKFPSELDTDASTSNAVPHWDLLEGKSWVDFDRGSKVTASGFPFYVGPVARLQRSLIQFFLDKAIEKGYIEMMAPYFVNEDSARGTGNIPDKEDMMYTIPRDGYYLIPTAEVPVTNYHRDEIFKAGDLPVRYVCYTPCWRREAGSHGSDVRGLNRLHQFDKVELVKLVDPDSSYEELELLRRDAEDLLEALELPYRTLLMGTADMGFNQSKKYDLEVWSPGQQKWLEVSSCSNFEAYQARRMMVRVKKGDGKTEMVHTLNGSALALPRVMAAFLETHHEGEGVIRIPEAFQPWTGSSSISL